MRSIALRSCTGTTIRDEMMTAWFGASWGAPANEHLPHAPVPVGLPCGDCTERIASNDQGMLIPQALVVDGKLSGTGALSAVHLLCFLRSIGVEP